MAQFDVYVNPQPAARAFVPYVVDVQSALVSHFSSRLAMPLSRTPLTGYKLPTNLSPIMRVNGEDLCLLPHMAAPVLSKALKNPVASLRERASDISAALDAVISGV